MFNGIFNRVVPQAFLTGFRRDGAASSAQAGVTLAHRVAVEEILGPVLSVMTFRTPEEAFERANNIRYGLSAGVWTDKGSKIFKMVNKLRAAEICFPPTNLTRSATTLSLSMNRCCSGGFWP